MGLVIESGCYNGPGATAVTAVNYSRECPIVMNIPKKIVDLKKADNKKVLEFIFDHPVREDPERDDPWYSGIRLCVLVDSVRYTEYLTDLFVEPGFLLDRYHPDQLEQGFSLLLSGTDELNLKATIWNEEIAWKYRDALIQSMAMLYEKLFSINSLQYASHMWWDALAYGYCSGSRRPEEDPLDARIQQSMFMALTKILTMNSPVCQAAALHGLNHLVHPETERVICAYLENHPELGKVEKEYALDCMRGEAM